MTPRIPEAGQPRSPGSGGISVVVGRVVVVEPDRGRLVVVVVCARFVVVEGAGPVPFGGAEVLLDAPGSEGSAPFEPGAAAAEESEGGAGGVPTSASSRRSMKRSAAPSVR